MYYKEALKVKKLRSDYKELELLKREWLDGTMAEEDLKDLGWRPNQKRIIRQDMDKYIQADKDIINMSLKIDYHSARANFLKILLELFMVETSLLNQ